MKKRFGLVPLLAASLVACGGGGGSSSSSSAPTPTPTPSNANPVASAGSDFAGSLAASGIALDGSASSDADGDTLIYSWTIETQPQGASATLNDADTARPTLATLVPGRYVIRLNVIDGNGGSAEDRVTLDLANDAPIVVLDNTPAQIAIGLPAGLNAGGSTDPNGHALTYQWIVTSAPAGSNLRSQFDGPAPLVEFDVEGDFDFRLEVSDGYATSTDTVSFGVSTFTQRALEHSYDYLETDASGDRTVTSRGNTVRVIDEDGNSAESFSLPATVLSLAVSPDGAWIGAAHLNQISIIDATTMAVQGTWPVSAEPGDLIIDNNGYAHVFPRTGQWVRVLTINPTTGAETFANGTVRAGTRVQMHPDGRRAYGADNGVSPSDVERYDIVNGVLTRNYDSPYHGDYPFCGNLWIAESGTDILTACGVVVSASYEPGSDLTFTTQIAILGQIIDAAYHAGSGYWYIIENVGGDVQLNLYDGAGGQWISRLDMPEITPGQIAIPLSIVTGNSSDFFQIFASDHPTNPQNFAIFTRAGVDAGALDYLPVPVAPESSAGIVGQRLQIDASASYDPEGEPLQFTWASVSEPTGSGVVLTGANQPIVSFTPSHSGDYELSLVVSDGTRTAAAHFVTVRVVEVGETLQFRLSGTPSDIAYNKVRNQLIYTVEDENELRIRDLDDFSEQVVSLDRPGEAVAVSPNGNFAAVSHAGMASLVEIRNDGAAVADVQAIRADWGDIEVDDRQFAYLIPRRDQWVSFHIADFAGDLTYETFGARAGTQIRLLPAGGAVYGANRGLSPSDIMRYSVTDVARVTERNSPYHGQYEMGGNLWINEQSDRILVAGGHIFRASDAPGLDMDYVETLSPRVSSDWADHSSENGSWAVISGNAIRLYSDTTYNQTGTVDLEPLFIDPTLQTPDINRAYYSNDGQQLIVVANSSRVADDSYVVQIIE
ncbi:MAG: hypothetical protein GYB36_05585 [Alphaproteobacteria bacterium]|nr:hypothetical protein [Alphaproteobacteria bacterium]